MKLQRTFTNVNAAQDIKLSRHKRSEPIDVFVPNKYGIYVSRTYLVDQKRKRVLLVDYEEARKSKEFQDAMREEYQSFFDKDCVEPMHHSELQKGSNLLSSKWVLTIKTKTDGTKRYKARLVARGFEDAMKDFATSDAPIASDAAQRLVLAVLAEKQWEPHSWDFKTAFLQGNCFTREVSWWLLQRLLEKELFGN